MFIKSLIYHVLLLRGSLAVRLSLTSLYLCGALWFIIFAIFFSTPPASASRMSDIMLRILVIYNKRLLYLLSFTVLAWLGCLIAVVSGIVKKSTFRWWRIGLLFPSPIAFFACSFIYGLFLEGHGTTVHKFMYELPIYIK